MTDAPVWLDAIFYALGAVLVFYCWVLFLHVWKFRPTRRSAVDPWEVYR